jgi:FtsZ-interacting cell division protein ZipA
MINVTGVVSVVIFYILILAVGMWAARKNSGIEGDQEVKKKEVKERKRKKEKERERKRKKEKERERKRKKEKERERKRKKEK